MFTTMGTAKRFLLTRLQVRSADHRGSHIQFLKNLSVVFVYWNEMMTALLLCFSYGDAQHSIHTIRETKTVSFKHLLSRSFDSKLRLA